MILRDLPYPRGHQVWEIEGGREVRVPQEGAQVRKRSERRSDKKGRLWARSWHPGLQAGKRECGYFSCELEYAVGKRARVTETG